MDSDGWITLRFMQADEWQRIDYFKIHINKQMIEARNASRFVQANGYREWDALRFA